MEIWELSATELRDLIASRKLSAREVALSHLERIRELDRQLHAFLEVDEELALELADSCDKKLASGQPARALEGVPLAIKDNMCLTRTRTTCASKILENWRPPYTATAVERALEAGCVPLGKTNLDEFAMGSSTENSAFGPTLNPWDPSRVPGGSSGGSAAAVAAGMAPLALGSDTGGSIRQPAALCGVVGFKPTYGRVSRWGLVAFASSLDQIGPMARNVLDVATLAQAISGRDKRDSTSSSNELGDLVGAARRATVKGMRIGLPKEYFGAGLAPLVEKAVREAVKVLEGLGACIQEVSLPHTEYAIATYYVVATAEASSNLARYDGVHYGYRAHGATKLVELYSRSRTEAFGKEVKRRIMLGTYVLSAGYYDAYYMRALKVRAAIRRDFDEAFSKVDLLACPTSPTVAFRLGEKASDPLAMYLSDIYTVSANLAALPAISIPCGVAEHGLPAGLQLIAPAFQEERLLSAARAYELASGALQARPPIWSAKAPAKGAENGTL